MLETQSHRRKAVMVSTNQQQQYRLELIPEPDLDSNVLESEGLQHDMKALEALRLLEQSDSHIARGLRDLYTLLSNNPATAPTVTKLYDLAIIEVIVKAIEDGSCPALQMTVQPNENHEIANILRLVTNLSNQGMLKQANHALEEVFQQSFFDLKETVGRRKASEVQYLIAKQLNDIETLASQYPLLTAKQATAMFGDLSTRSVSRTINTACQEDRLFVFYFGDAKNAQIPEFQFNVETLGVHEVVPRLCKVLKGINDWAVYKWFSSYSEDLGCTPANAIERKERWDDLVYLAGIFASSCNLRDLNYVARDSQ